MGPQHHDPSDCDEACRLNGSTIGSLCIWLTILPLPQQSVGKNLTIVIQVQGAPPTDWLSPSSLPFLMVHFGCEYFVNKVSSKEGYHGGVTGCGDASGEHSQH